MPPACLPSLTSLDDVQGLLSDLPGPDEAACEKVRLRNEKLTKPAGALGRLEAIPGWLAAWQQREVPQLDRVRLQIFAGTHAMADKGVSAYPSAVTAQMVANFDAGGAAINQLAHVTGAELKVIALDLDRPAGDMTKGPALTEEDVISHLNVGLKAVQDRPDLLILGEMGIGNTFSAAVICHALFGGDAATWTGRGTGLTQAQLDFKTRMVSGVVNGHRNNVKTPLGALQYLGGREIAALTGAILGARLFGVPVLLDGYVVGAAAAVLYKLEKSALDHAWAAHVSAEPGHRVVLEKLGLHPLLDLGMRLGEGSGAAFAVPLIRGALACHNGMATFEEAGVSGPS